ncbi:MAG TPA: hypothetical protein VF169_21840 [Albitalea sp.]|uniref:hypothetical protein n=1 Tax=Piscinibacter sp. TaxID=1903157 RepID=UPI002ED42826
MSLPIDIAGSLWFMPTALWEWEPDPQSPPPEPDAASLGGPDTQPEAAPPPLRLVFKGYANDAAFHWFAADSLLARPWERSRTDDADRRRLPEPPLPLPDDAGDKA